MRQGDCAMSRVRKTSNLAWICARNRSDDDGEDARDFDDTVYCEEADGFGQGRNR